MNRRKIRIMLYICICATILTTYIMITAQTGEEINKNRDNGMANTSGPRQSAYVQDNNGPIPVIILTYMRSGSSFLGEILQANSDTFYWFEPVHELWGLYKADNHKQFDFKDGTKRAFKTFLDLAIPTIRNISTCELESLPMGALREQFLSKSEQMKEFVNCRGYEEHGHTTNKKLIRCLPDLNTKCLQSKHIVIKTIRIRMKSLGNILEKIPSLKVIHLMRDPRGTFRSQKVVGQLSKQNYRTEIYGLCNQIYKDILERESLHEKYPGRIRTVFYEDVANNPIVYSKSLYYYLGMNFTSDVEKTIFGFTLAGKSGSKKCGILCTQMANSSQEASNWRDEISMELVKIVDNACSDLYNKIGYKSILNETELRNKKYTLRK
ncbi:carbohydrate sulfotransferase 1-like [Pecten maximus]|uniref:carbohydrate sulfotransferase 1-like n=1 Tax=Pecten maximus TaxID=6579 RepID=UPI0014589F76|nr:carbohydrate sulfotransferase 1-like [Pecten maximus]